MGGSGSFLSGVILGGDWVSTVRNQRRLPGAHGSWEAARLTPSRRTPLLCAQKGVCVRERRSCALKKNPSVFWETLGSAFQRHRLRFKPIRGWKSTGGRRGMRRRPRSSWERPAGPRRWPLGDCTSLPSATIFPARPVPEHHSALVCGELHPSSPHPR